jgi:hypothetical protein
VSQSHFVMIYTGEPPAEALRSVGPFSSAEAASAWCQREELGQTPIAGEWASVVAQAPERPGDQ